jgi:ubiquinone/menaquinone biosynthesis C-methylase UbiE
MADAVDFQTVTKRQQTTWATGDFNVIAAQTMAVAEDLCRAVDPHPTQAVLDVACGSGNVALVAARRYCVVTGIDYVPALVERAKLRAKAEGPSVDFKVADAQALPFPDASFDVVASVFGVMFAPDQEKAAGELLRVARRGGKIAIASWMPEGFGGDFFRANSKYLPPPPGLKPGVRWGTDPGLSELLGSGTSSIKTERRTFMQYYPSVEHAFEVFKAYFGPTSTAYAAADDAGRANLKKDICDVFSRYNRATDGTAMIESAYLLAIATRK